MESLANAQVGEVYGFDYKQPLSGQTRRHLAKVVQVKKLTENDINRLYASSRYRWGDSQFQRTETIVVCQMHDGKYRNFYAERTENCTRSTLARFLFWSGAARLILRG
jgi:hypothetical protein